MIDFSKAIFIKSAPDLSFRPEKKLPEICFVGRSNVGKSSLINALTKHNKLAYVSSKPGFTKLLNFYLIDDSFYLVDAPGYGYTNSGRKHLSSFGKMMETYFDNDKLKGVAFLIDARHAPSEDDLSFYEFIVEKNIPFLLIATKVDKLNQSEKAKMKKNIEKYFPFVDCYEVSIKNSKLLEQLKEKLVALALN